MKPNDARYFTHVEGFGDDTVFFRFRGSGRGKRIAKDGSEHQSRISLRQALTSAKHGAWVEITEQQAKDLIQYVDSVAVSAKVQMVAQSLGVTQKDVHKAIDSLS